MAEASDRQATSFFAHFVARGPLQLLDDGTLVFIGYGYGKESRKFNDDPKSITWESGRSNVYCLRCAAGDETWELVLAADGHLSPMEEGFTETFPIIASDGNMFFMLRTALGNHAYSITSSDGGRTWTMAVRTPIRAKHPLPTLLRDGTIVCSYQRRFAPPFGVRAPFTSDRGKTWSQDIVLRDDIPISDNLAEPNTVEFSDDTAVYRISGVQVRQPKSPAAFHRRLPLVTQLPSTVRAETEGSQTQRKVQCNPGQ